MTAGYLALILHAHLPFVRHPEHSWFLEERWLFEAVGHCYLPLLDLLDGLAQDRVKTRLTLSLTPTLMAGLDDHQLRDKCAAYLQELVRLAEKETQRTRDTEYHELAQFYAHRFSHQLASYQRHHRDLVSAFARHQEAGRLELLASAATHAYLPLAGTEAAARAQILTGVDTYRQRLGRAPRGFWLPECGYRPGLDRHLAEAGIEYVILETHGVTHAVPRPRYSYLAPIVLPAKVAAFGRDPESSKQVWSADEGYPGDPHYRDFYRDIGFDLDYEYIRPHLGPAGQRLSTGVKYHRITHRGGDHKEIYRPHIAYERAIIHAQNFLFNRAKQVEWCQQEMDRPPLLVCPYDAELFGHWWFEGPWWLDQVLRHLATHPVLEPVTCGEYLDRHPQNQRCQSSLSSWGYRGFSEVWLEGSNHWMYRHLDLGARRMEELARRFPQPSDLERRALNQAARQLLLAQASDWAFILKTGTFPGYARRRFAGHMANFLQLYHALCRGNLDAGSIASMEELAPLLATVDYRQYLPEAGKAKRSGA